MFVHQLNWGDVDPDTHDFDPESTLSIAINAIKSTSAGTISWPHMVEDNIDRDFIDRYGSWATGWRFSIGEGGGGGVVTAWCCPAHSVLCSSPDDDPTSTAQKAAEGLQQWYEHLKQTKRLFEELVLNFDNESVAALDLYSAGARIIAFVANSTGTEDAWYAYAEKVLSWYLEYLGLDAKTANKVAANVVSGKFESWVAPDTEVIDQAASDLMSTVVPLILHQTKRS